MTKDEQIEELLTRGVEDVIVREELEKKLKSGKQLRIKLGIDPTGPLLHIGRAIPLWKLRAFQELGHQVIFLIGDFTGLIGDASDKQAERKKLTLEEVTDNMQTYTKQMEKILDMSKVEVVYNSEWLTKLTFLEVVELADNFSVAEMLDRENFSKRYEGGKRISLREFLYPLMQGYDSVALKADVEVGGTDQLFNLLAGRTLQKTHDQEPQNIMTFTLLEGLDGRKMSTSYGNIIAIWDEPADMYGKIMSMQDELIIKYFTLCTRVPLEEVQTIEQKLEAGENPRDIKMQLAREIVGMYHSEEDAQEAEARFIQQFQKKEIPDDIPEATHTKGSHNVIDLMSDHKLVKSKSEARRLIEQGGVKIDGKVVESIEAIIIITKTPKILQVGKRRFLRVQAS